MSIYTWVVIGAWAAFILFWAYSAIGVKRDAMRIGGIFGTLVGRIVIAGLALAAAHYLLVLTRYYNLTRVLQSASTTAAMIGAAFAVLGVALAIWSRIHLGKEWSSSPALKEGHALVTSGPYAMVRHPIYTGMLLAILGSGLVTPSWFFIFIAAFILFVWRVRVEERLMTEQFPDQYPAYKARTWALIPYVW